MNLHSFASILRFQGSPIQHSIGLRREHQLLLHYARTEMAEDHIGEVLALLLQGGIDWAYLLKCGGRHRVLPLFYANFKRHLAERVPADIDGAAIRTLGPEDLLLFLCLHGSKHRWESLGWICDIQELINSQLKIDWERVARDARRLGLEKMLASGLEIVRNLLGTRLPDEVLRSLPVDRMTRELAREAEVSLFREDRESSVEAPCQLNRYFLKSMSQWRDRFLACAQAFMIPSYYKFLAIHFPSPAFFLYYLFRPMRLAAKYTKGLLPS
jgi:hypothetical protein